MKNLLLSLSLIIFINTHAQVTRDLSYFKKVTAFDKIAVVLEKSTSNRIEITGDLANEVQVIQKDYELKIRLPLGKLLKGDDIIAKVYYTDIEDLEANEGATITAYQLIKSAYCTLIAKEGAQIQANIEAKKLTVKCYNGSEIEITGSADNADITINTGGIFTGKDFITVQTSVSVSAGGAAQVYATELVDAKVRAGGEINIYGDPSHVTQKTILGGSIQIK
jgi:hypothetical protein